MEDYLEDTEEVLKETGSSMKGLDDAEAAGRLTREGPNKLQEAKKESLGKKFLAEIRIKICDRRR